MLLRHDVGVAAPKFGFAGSLWTCWADVVGYYRVVVGIFYLYLNLQGCGGIFNLYLNSLQKMTFFQVPLRIPLYHVLSFE